MANGIELSLPVDPEQIDPKFADPEERFRFLKAAQAGDESVMPMVRKILDQGGLVKRMAIMAQQTVIKQFFGTDLLMIESANRECAQLRKKLAGEAPSPLEELLIERIVLCWLELQGYEAQYAQIAGESAFESHEFYQKRIDRAHRRFLSACKALATIRRLAVPDPLTLDGDNPRATLDALLPKAPAALAAAVGGNGNGRHG